MDSFSRKAVKVDIRFSPSWDAVGLSVIEFLSCGFSWAQFMSDLSKQAKSARTNGAAERPEKQAETQRSAA